MLKKSYIILFFVTILLTVNISVFAKTLYSGSCGENVSYTIDDEYNLVISGEGAMWEYENAIDTKIPWKEYRSHIHSVLVQDGVVSIGKTSFALCESIIDVTLPNSISNISNGAFMYCESLHTIKIPSSVTILSSRLLLGCANLNSVNFYNSVTHVESRAFEDCNALQTVYFYGTEEEWNAITIADGNEALLNAEKVFIYEVQPISITIHPNKSTYILGQDTELDITVNLNYNDGTTTPLLPDDYTLETDFDPTTEGEYTVKATYGDFTDEITVSVEPLTMKSIAITIPPDKTEFISGTELDLSGMVVTGYYNDGTCEGITDYTVSGYNSSRTGKQTITIEYNGLTTTLVITVAPVRLTGIRIASPPDKLYYDNDETSLDLTGLVVEAVYNNGTSKVVDKYYTVSGFDGTKAGEQTVTVSYSGFTAQFEVFVKVYEYKVDAEISKSYDFDTQTLTIGTTVTSRTDAGAVKVIVAVYGDNNALMKASIKDVFFDTNEQKQLNMALTGVSYPFGKIKVFVWGFDLMKMTPMAVGV